MRLFADVYGSTLFLIESFNESSLVLIPIIYLSHPIVLIPIIYLSHPIVVDCGPPSIPGNGNVSVGLTIFGSIAAYMCISGYRLSSASFTRSCQADSEWSGADPTCNRKLAEYF